MKHIVIDGRPWHAGTGRVIDRLVHFLQEIDKENKYTILVEPTKKIEFKNSNFSTQVSRYKRFSMNPLQQFGLAWQLYRLKPDVVFFTQTGITPLFYFGKNITLTHDLTMFRFARPGKLPAWLHKIRMAGYALLFWKGNKFASRILVPTKYVKKDLINKQKNVSDKITVVHEAGVEPISLKPKKPKDKRISKPFIFHAGVPFAHKNIKNLVLAFEILKNDHPNLKLVLVGKKEHYFTKLENWTKTRDYSDDIIFTGFIPDEELKWLYENAECYTWPSLSEGFGLPGIEAMSNSCPLASSDATCLPEVYEDAAMYFNPNSPKDMAKQISKVIDSKKIKADLIKKGHKQAKKYSWKKMAKQMHQVILEVAG